MDHDPTLFENCDVVVSDTLVSQRMAACPLEVRSAAAERTDGRITAWLSTQVPHRDHHGLCPTLGLDPHELRDHRAGRRRRLRREERFGAEEAIIVWLAKNSARRFAGRRRARESMIALAHGRGQWLEMTLGGTRDGKVLAYRLDVIAGLRRLPRRRRVHAEPHRDARDRRLRDPAGRGRGPLGGHEHDADDDVPRRRPARGGAGDRAHDGSRSPPRSAWIRPRCGARTSSPRTPSRTRRTPASTYDSGDYEGALDLALRAAGYDELRAEQKRRREEGGPKQLGIGISTLYGDHEPARRDRVRRGRDHGGRRARSCTPARSPTARDTRRRSR